MPLYWIWFARLCGIRSCVKRQLLQKFNDAEGIYSADDTMLKQLPADVQEALANRDLTEAKQILQQCKQRGIGIMTYGDAMYPQNLRNIADPPMVLYFKGKLPDWQAQPMIGVVGTRKASPYGLQTAKLLAAQIANCGGIVVSGAAAGVDKAAMEGALDVGKCVVGVLGGGVDVVYPTNNRTLYGQAEENGCLISEYAPGSRPFPGNFLHRNRIISGISQGVLVVEAPEKSGALNTAQHAFDQGRDLFAVPANLGVETGKGSNGLLQEGAYAVFEGWDVMKHYAPLYPGVVENRPLPVKRQMAKVAEAPMLPRTPAKNPIDNEAKSTYSVINKQPDGLSEQETALYALLGSQPRMIDSILDEANLPYGAAQSILTRLTLKGLVTQHPDGRVSRK